MTTLDLIGKILQVVGGLVAFGVAFALVMIFLDREARASRGVVLRLIAAAIAAVIGLLGLVGVIGDLFGDGQAIAAQLIGWPLAVALLVNAIVSVTAPRIARIVRFLMLLAAAVSVVGLALVIEATSDTTVGVWPWAAAAAIAVSGLLGYLASAHDEGKPMVAFLVPAAILITVGLVYPALRTALLAFTDKTGAFTGLDNFVWMFTQQSALIVLLNTVVWVVLVPTVSTIVGLAYAVFIDGSRGEKVYKMLVFMPMAISFVGAGIIWKFMYAYRGGDKEQFGLINQIITMFGGEPQQLLQNSPWNTVALIVVMIWVQTGFAMVVLSAAIKGVPIEQHEAAELDGASPWQRFRNVTVPGIRGSLVVVVTTITIATLKVFDIVRTMTGGNFDTSVVANEMYTQAFRSGEPGRGAALALILFLMVTPIVIYNVRVMQRQKEIR